MLKIHLPYLLRFVLHVENLQLHDLTFRKYLIPTAVLKHEAMGWTIVSKDRQQGWKYNGNLYNFSKLVRDLVDIRQGYSGGAENCATS